MKDIERLTIKSKFPNSGYCLKQAIDCDGYEFSCEEYCGRVESDCHNCVIQKAINLLAEYENTGLTPDEINDLQALAGKMNVQDLVMENLRLARGKRYLEAALSVKN